MSIRQVDIYRSGLQNRSPRNKSVKNTGSVTGRSGHGNIVVTEHRGVDAVFPECLEWVMMREQGGTVSYTDI